MQKVILTIAKIFRIDWFQAMRFSLWLHFLPHRIICSLTHHKYGRPADSMTVGPLHLPPNERDYHVLSYHRFCKRCLHHIDEPLTDAMRELLIEKAREDDWEEWNDPEVRAVLEKLG